ncbi:MAG TPA: gliding motility protein GldL [Chitinophagaceae bacterium]|nr:gliding motility protein GldL [Chitinophagaceae bacterium]
MAAKIPPTVSKWFDVGVSIGAAVVIYGALQKLLHTEYADKMLIVGLTTEACIFLGYGLLYIFFPYMDDHEVHIPGQQKVETSPLVALNDMFREAGLSQEQLTKLSGSFEKLSTTVSQLSEITDVVKATSDFSAKTKEASAALNSVTGAVNIATTSLAGFNAASENTKQFHSQVQILTKNLSSLNTIYELELQESNNHLKSLNQFYGKLAQASSAMNSSADDAMKAKEQISELATNLSKLNQVYGNMLTAMHGGR